MFIHSYIFRPIDQYLNFNPNILIMCCICRQAGLATIRGFERGGGDAQSVRCEPGRQHRGHQLLRQARDDG